MEKYSVLMSLYTKEKAEYLRLAIDSMITQTVAPDEIVIVEDGPINDELNSVLGEYVKKYPGLFNIIVNEQNIGLGLSLNNGLKACKNELVARMDTDDISKPDRCEKQLKVFEANPELSIVSGFVEEFCISPDKVESIRVVPTTHEKIYEFAKRRSAFNHPAVMFRKSSVLSMGGYADLRRNQDVDLFGRMLFSGYKAANIGESILWFRSNNALAKRRKSWENSKSYITTIRRFWKMGYSSFLDYLIVACAQTVMFLLPARLQQWAYKTFLRK